MKTFFILLIICGSCIAQEVQLSKNAQTVQDLMSTLFRAYHNHLEGWEQSDQKADAISNLSHQEITTSLKALKKIKQTTQQDKNLLSAQFEKSLSLLNRRLVSLEKNIQPKRSKSYQAHSEKIETLIEKNMPTLLSYVAAEPKLAEQAKQ